MSDELDALDRACAEAMGYTQGGSLVKGDPPSWVHPKYKGNWKYGRRMPSPTRSWEDFGALLVWCAEKGLAPMVRYGIAVQKWNGSMGDENGVVKASEYGPDPRIALARAVKAWRESK